MLSLVLDGVPFVETAITAERRELDSCFTNGVAISNVLVHHVNGHIIANILNIDDELLFWPLWVLTSIRAGLSSNTLHTRLNEDVRIHITKHLSVSCEPGLYYLDG